MTGTTSSPPATESDPAGSAKSFCTSTTSNAVPSLYLGIIRTGTVPVKPALSVGDLSSPAGVHAGAPSRGRESTQASLGCSAHTVESELKLVETSATNEARTKVQDPVGRR